MHIDDIAPILAALAPILNAIGFLITAVVGLMGYLQSRRNGEGQVTLAKEQAVIKTDMRELALNTNSIKDALVVAVAQANLAEGTAIGLEQGRKEQRP
jgi:hypothetical protein